MIISAMGCIIRTPCVVMSEMGVRVVEVVELRLLLLVMVKVRSEAQRE